MIDYIGNELELFQYAVNWKKYFSSKIKKYIKGDVLEVGAGIGVNTSYLISSDAGSWTLLEPDEKLATKIMDNTTAINIPKKVVNGIIDDLGGEKFDTIIYIDVLEHIEHSKEEIKKIEARLNKGGHLIVLVPAFQFLFNEFDSKLGHFRRYDKTVIRNEIDAKLTEVELFYLDSVGLLASVANKMFLKQSEINLSQVRFWDSVLVPLSKIADFIIFKTMGKSLIGVWEKK